MNVLLLTIGSHGDVHPFVGMGIELRRRGHDVTLITNGYFESLARSAELQFAALGTEEEFYELARNPDLWHPRRAFQAIFLRVVLPILEDAYRLVEQHHVPGNTVLVASCLGFAGRIAQEKLNIPTASAHTAPSIIRSIHDVPRLPGLFMPNWFPLWLKRKMWEAGDRFVLDPQLAPPINEFRARLGLPPVKGILNQWWHSPQLVLGLWPEWYSPAQPDWPPQVRAVGFPLYDETGITPLSEELSAWLASGEAPIAFTPGSAMLHGREFFEASARACVRLNRRGLLLTRHAGQIPADLPPMVRHFDYAPFAALLPHCAALVHHGGIGTTSQALRAGVPQLVMPMAHDQFDNAARIERLGCGRWLRRRAYRAPRVARMLDELIRDPRTAARAKEVAKRFETMNALDTAADLIERLGACGDSQSLPANSLSIH